MDCVSAETDDAEWGIRLIPDLAIRELGEIPY
jgi:hypothetical protein